MSRSNFGLGFVSSLALGLALALLPASVFAFDVAETSTVLLSDGSLVTFDSAFCEVVVGDMVTVTLLEGVDPSDVAITGGNVRSNGNDNPRATPNKGNGDGFRTASITISGTGDNSVDITLDGAEDGWHTVHIDLFLSTGDKLGIQLHSTGCPL